LFQVFRPRTAPEAIDLVSKLLEYTPGARSSAIEALAHPFFDELRVEGARMPNGRDFPPLFNFTREGKCYFPFTWDKCPALTLVQSSLCDQIFYASLFRHTVNRSWPRGLFRWTTLYPCLLNK